MTDRILSFLLYSALVIATIWAGLRATDYFMDYHFYRGFLEPWRRGFVEYSALGAPWPRSDGWNRAEYMNNLVTVMGRKIDFLPPAGDGAPYRYRLKKQRERSQDIFLLLQPGKMVIFGLTPVTAQRVDYLADGDQNLTSGDFTATFTESGASMTATWQF